MNQNIEVDYNKEMVQEDLTAQKNNDQDLLVQDTFNQDSLEDMIDEGCVIDDN